MTISFSINLILVIHSIAPGSKLYHQLITDKAKIDHMRPLPIFFPLKAHLTTETTPEGMKNYHRFLTGFLQIVKDSPNNQDKLARQLRHYVYQWYVKKLTLSRISTSFWAQQKESSPIENVVYAFENHATACGINSMVLKSLLRYVNIPVRLLIIAADPHVINTSHVITEYYSDKYKKWILLDASYDFSPFIDNRYLSAFELENYLANSKPGYIIINQNHPILHHLNLGERSYFKKNNIIVYSNVGPITHTYYFSPSIQTRKRIEEKRLR